MLDFIVGFLRSVMGNIVDLLPQSPFQEYYSGFGIAQQGLGWLNWFVPVGTLLAIMTAWLVAIAGYYVFKALLHWIGLGD